MASRRSTRRSTASSGTTAVHICFGYAAVVKDKPSGYSFLSELERSAVGQVSIEAAQPKLDLSILRQLPSKTIILGVLDLSDLTAETPATVADRIRKALAFVPAERIVVAPDCGLKYLPRDVAYGKMRAMVEGAAIVREEMLTKWQITSNAKCHAASRRFALITSAASCGLPRSRTRGAKRERGEISAEALAQIEDREIEKVIRRQEDIGLAGRDRRRVSPRVLELRFSW